MRRPRLLIVAVLLGSAVLSGCGGPERSATAPDAAPGAAFREAAGTREAALQALDSLQRGALQHAFADLDRYAFTRRVRTEQLSPAGRVTAFEARVARHQAGGGAQVLRSDSSGRFDFGWLGHFTSTASEKASPSALAQHVLPDEPAFLTPRNQYAFQYRLLPDTTLGGRTARVVAVRAHPDEGDEQALRSARLYLDRATGQLVAVRLHRAHRSMLFDEDTRLFLRLRPAPGTTAPRTNAEANAAWVPAETRFRTRFQMPLRSERRFRTTATYSRYQRPA